MRRLVGVLLCCGLAVAMFGCSPTTDAEWEAHWRSEEAKQSAMRPIKIGEADGVTLWKVRDATGGGGWYIYFTTPNGQVIDD